MNKYRGWGVYGSIILVAIPFGAYGDSRSDRIRAELREFDLNTASFMMKVPVRTADDGVIPARPRIPSSASKSDLINEEMDRLQRGRTHHGPARESFMLEPQFSAPAESHDRAEDLVDHLKFKTLEEMESSQILQPLGLTSNLGQERTGRLRTASSPGDTQTQNSPAGTTGMKSPVI